MQLLSIKSQNILKINEDHPNENGLFPQSRGVGHLHLLWWKLKGRQGTVGTEGRVQSSMFGEEAAGRLTGCISWDWFGEHIWFSLVGPELESGGEMGELAVTGQVLTLLRCLPQMFWFDFSGQLLQRLSVTWSYMI